MLKIIAHMIGFAYFSRTIAPPEVTDTEDVRITYHDCLVYVFKNSDAAQSDLFFDMDEPFFNIDYLPIRIKYFGVLEYNSCFIQYNFSFIQFHSCIRIAGHYWRRCW